MRTKATPAAERRMIMAKCTGMRCPMQVGYKVDECNYKECPYRTEPITNADKIRAMSDEELATMLKDYKDCSKNCIISNGKHCYQICEEESILLKWLQKPAE